MEKKAFVLFALFSALRERRCTPREVSIVDDVDGGVGGAVVRASQPTRRGIKLAVQTPTARCRPAPTSSVPTRPIRLPSLSLPRALPPSFRTTPTGGQAHVLLVRPANVVCTTYYDLQRARQPPQPVRYRPTPVGVSRGRHGTARTPGTCHLAGRMAEILERGRRRGPKANPRTHLRAAALSQRKRCCRYPPPRPCTVLFLAPSSGSPPRHKKSSEASECLASFTRVPH